MNNRYDINISGAGTTLTVTANIFPKPMVFSGFGEDDLIDVPDYEMAQLALGIDSKVSGWVERAVVDSTVTLAPNSPIIKEALIPIQQAQMITDMVVVLTLHLVIPSLKMQYIFSDAILKSGLTPGTVKKRVDQRKFIISSRPPQFFPIQ